MSDDPFFERLRGDAAMLRHRPDDATLARIHARIQERLAPRVTVMELLALWIRPVAATMAAIALAAAIGIVAMDRSDAYDDAVTVVMGGDSYSVTR